MNDTFPEIRTWRAEDVEAILALNNATTPALSRLDRVALTELLGWSSPTLVAIEDGAVVGFLECLGPGLAYASENYRWFSQRYPAFAYVDRVAVRDSHRSRGLGARLYERLIAQLDAPVLLCEVNIDPPNPGSLTFHRRLGFREVGQQATEGGAKRVVMLARDLTIGSPQPL